MKYIAAALAAATSLVTASAAVAQTGFYVGASAGLAFFFDEEIEDGGANFDLEYDKPGYVFAGLLGYQIATNIRIEGEVSYAFSDAEADASVLGVEVAQNGFDISVLSGTAGLFLDLWPIASFVPYVGGGAGYSRVEVNIDGSLPERDQDAFMLFGEAGLPYSLTPELSIVPSARFNWIMTDEEVGDGDLFSDDLYTTEVRLGMRYAF